jgi:GxxExxY protein
MHATLQENEQAAIRLSDQIVDAAETVHGKLGPGLPKMAYENALCEEFEARGIVFDRNVWLPEHYKGMTLACGYNIDFVVGNRMVVELNAGDTETSGDEQHLLHLLRLSRYRLGLLIDFRKRTLTNGVKRLAYTESPSSWV